MLRRIAHGRERGAGFAEYAGLVVLAALILGALVATGIPQKITPKVSSAVCQILGGDDCGKPEASGQNGGQNDGDDGAKNGSDDGGQNGDDPTLGDLAKQADDAQKAADAADNSNLKQQIIDLLKDFVGITDVEKCITEGDIASCLWAVFDVGSLFFAVLKIGKFAKAVKSAITLWKDFNRGRKAFERARTAAKAAQTRYGKKLTRLQHGCGGNSFTGDTLVVLSTGRARPIKDMRPGDVVKAGDPRTGRNTAVPVRRLITGSGEKAMVRLKVAGDPYGLTSATVNATANHPFWVPNGHSWVEAGKLHPNDRLTTSGGSGLRVLARTGYIRRTAVFNLSVGMPHTYYVRAGSHDVLVHNTPPDGCLLTGKGPKIFSKTVKTAKDRSWRVDIENPVPGKPSANMHLQLMGRGAKKGDKYFYNPSTGEWLTEGGKKLPDSVAKQVPQSTIDKGLEQLGA